MKKTKVAIIGPGNIGTDLMFKVMRLSEEPRDGGHGRHRPDSDGLRRRGQHGIADHARGRRRAHRHGRLRRDRHRLRRHVRQGPRGQRRQARRPWQEARRPDPGGDRPLHRPSGQPRGAPRGRVASTGQRQHGHVRRSGDHPDRRGDLARHRRALRRDRRVDRIQVGRTRHAGQHRRVHRDHARRHREGGRRRAAARRSSSSTRPSRRSSCATPSSPSSATRTTTRSGRRSRTWSPRSQEYVPGYRLKQQVQFTPIPPDEPVHTLLPKGSGAGDDAGDRLPRGRGSGALPACLRRQPRHHDLGRPARRRDHRGPIRHRADHEPTPTCRR